MAKEKVPVLTRKELHEKIRKAVEESQGEFKTVEEYVDFTLNETVKEKEEETHIPEEEEDREEAKSPRIHLISKHIAFLCINRSHQPLIHQDSRQQTNPFSRK